MMGSIKIVCATSHKVDMSNLNTTKNWYCILSGVWLGMDTRFGTKETRVLERLDYVLKTCYSF